MKNSSLQLTKALISKKILMLVLCLGLPVISLAFDSENFQLAGIGDWEPLKNILEKKENQERLKNAVDVGKKIAKSREDISEEDEIKMGNKLAAQLLGAAPLVDNEGLQTYVNRVGFWLALQSERPDLPWRFGVLEDEDVNAFSMPGGIVLITKGMYQSMRNEAELAGVLAHEISHVIKTHQVQQIKKAMGNEWKASLISAVAQEQDNKNAEYAARALTAGMEIYTRGLDKEDEFEADRDGVVLAAKGGYNPYGLVAVLQTLGNISGKDSRVALMFSTHPSPTDRQDFLAEAMADRLDKFADGVETTERFFLLEK